MKWVLPCLLLALQVPIDAPLAKPDDRDAHERRRQAIVAMNEGVAEHRRRNDDAAIAALERAVELDPDYSRARVNLGRMYIETGRKDPAEAELTRALELIALEQARLGPGTKAETKQALAELRGEVHWDLGRLLFERLERQRDPDPAKQAALARRALAEFGDEALESDFRAQHQRGRLHDQLDEALEADRSYRACIELQPDHMPCYADLVHLYADYGAFDVAEAIVDAGLLVKNTSAELWLASAWLHLQRNRPKEAADAAKKAVTIDPDLADAWFVRGMALAELRERVEAIEALQQYLGRAIAPSDERRRQAETVLARFMEPI